jgi:hypothetical protein
MLPRLQRKNFKWNPDLAYAIGLITTDGNLSRDKRHISLTSSDKELAKTFLRCVDKTNKISINPRSSLSIKTCYRTQVGDVVFYEWLEKIGLTPKKSLTIGSLKIEEKYFPDFLRGHLDGDGSIVYYKDSYNIKLNKKYIYDRLFVFFRSASYKHIVWIRKIIFKLKGVHGALMSQRSRTQIGSSTMSVLKFSTKEAKTILNWIYYKKELPCLERKYKIAKPFLQYLPQ